jgi:hypothetical protein
VLPSSQFIEDIDEYEWVWMYQSWLQDQEEMHKTYKDYALFLGAFFNSEMAQNIWKQESPDFSSSDDDFNQATQNMVKQRVQEQAQIKHRRKRRVVPAED